MSSDDERMSASDEDMMDFAEPALCHDASQLPAGIVKTVTQEGSGTSFPERGDEVEVHYTGTLTEGGEEFDSSRGRGQTFKFTIGTGSVIKGWDLGVATMVPGERATFVLPSQFAYGDHGSPPKIPGGASLTFDVELISFKSQNDLRGDGTILFKQEVKKGSGYKSPGRNDDIIIDLKVECDGMAVMEKTGMEVKVGARVAGFLEPETQMLIVKKLKVGGTSQFEIAHTAGIVDAANFGVPADSPLLVTITLGAILASDDCSTMGDNSLVKRKHNDPSWSMKEPEVLSNVTVKVWVSGPDGQHLVGSPSEPVTLEFSVGDATTCELLDLVVLKMKKTEIADVTSDDPTAYACEKLGLVGTHQSVKYHIELVEVSKDVEFKERTPEERLAALRTLKDLGGRLFKERRLRFALSKYKLVVSKLESKSSLSDAGADDDEEEKPSSAAEEAELGLSCELNISQCYLSLCKWNEALKQANVVIAKDAKNIKALYRAATAQIEMEEVEEAVALLGKLLEVEPENAPAKALLVKAKHVKAARKAKESKLYSKLFAAPKKTEAAAEAAKDADKAEAEVATVQGA